MHRIDIRDAKRGLTDSRPFGHDNACVAAVDGSGRIARARTRPN
jgi:hypothetical protein